MSSTITQVQLQSNMTSRLVELLSLLAREDVYARILLALARCKHGCLSLRGLAREVNMAPKNVKKYVLRLMQLGIVKIDQIHEKMLLIRLSDEFRWLREAVSETEQRSLLTTQPSSQ